MGLRHDSLDIAFPRSKTAIAKGHRDLEAFTETRREHGRERFVKVYERAY